MASITPHGGGCCGIRHLRNFSGLETKEEIQGRVNSLWQRQDRGILVEVVLTNRQLTGAYGEQLGKNLKEVGFELVNRFRNRNSGNICNVFHYNVKKRELKGRLPAGLNVFRETKK